ncbi:MAG: L-threonylcarbamoyladenylate synthase [Candidatus Aenigmarchaeota archaeon]|nr:L-threonylcarbamoyladenylate synthase [Candidatus Aenigmarchaeota archaeon]MDI6722655.1 L-threonylcarbamoyladenylate synthase [Candidatus Aenigmarchaeota archaeon]
MTIISKDVRLAVDILKKGGIVAYPTESSYALGCDGTKKRPARKIYVLKKRSPTKNFTVIIGSLKTAEKHGILGEKERKLMRKLMPGRITLVTKGRKGGEFAFRIPSHRIAFELAKAFGRPVTATSANISGEEPIFSAKKLASMYNGKIDMVLDGGNLPKRKPSTVVDLFDGINIRRKGPVSKKEIEEAL